MKAGCMGVMGVRALGVGLRLGTKQNESLKTFIVWWFERL